MCVLELEENVMHGYLPFIEKDIHNIFLKINIKVEGNYAMDFLKYCENTKKKSCSKFQYTYTLDEEKMLEHIFGPLLLTLII